MSDEDMDAVSNLNENERRLVERLEVLASATKAVEDTIALLLPEVRQSLVMNFPSISADLLDDAVQDAAVQVIQSTRKGVSVASPLAYLFTTARSRLLDRLRREQTRTAREVPLPIADELPDMIRQLDSTRSPPLDPDETRPSLTNETLSRAMEQLSGVERAILALRFQSGWKLREIASALSLPVSTVGAKSFAALRRLRNIFGIASDT